ncbi:YciI family protein [Shimazuella kribbensis]|uniref:YciI family protein n=1 Tax=Shimazuella kribbensis TaxID=139808 RepID=UPI0004027A59|nr:YciI family protein [Shimazuella kribbensis]
MQYIIMVSATEYSEAGVKHCKEYSNAINRYRDSLDKAGVLLVTEELQPSGTGIKISYSHHDEKPGIKAGPFSIDAMNMAEYTLIQVYTEEEALHWALQMPVPEGRGKFEIELRKLKDHSSSIIKPLGQALETDLVEQLNMLKNRKHLEESQ